MLRPIVSFMNQDVSGHFRSSAQKLTKGLTAARFVVDVHTTNVSNQWDEKYKNRYPTVMSTPNGPEIGRLVYDLDPGYMHYDPDNPLADKKGYVRKRKDKTLENSVDIMAGGQWYQLNITGVHTLNKMQQAALKIGD